MIILSLEQVLLMHKQLIEESGGSDEVRDIGLLKSAIYYAYLTFGGVELYPSIQDKAARLCFGIVKNHALVDGNKRLGTHVMLVFLWLNGYTLEYQDEEMINIILDLASGKITADQLMSWIIDHQM